MFCWSMIQSSAARLVNKLSIWRVRRVRKKFTVLRRHRLFVIPTDEAGVERSFDCSVFDGRYVTNDIDDAYLDRLKENRSNAAKKLVDVEIDAEEMNEADIQEVM